jgi:hypothetical protein
VGQGSESGFSWDRLTAQPARSDRGWGKRGNNMLSGCSFERLVKLLDKKLNLDESLEVYDHLDRCDICRDAIYLISRDRDEAILIYRPYKVRQVSAA